MTCKHSITPYIMSKVSGLQAFSLAAHSLTDTTLNSCPMTLRQAICSVSQKLGRAGIDDASVEAEFLLCHAAGISRTQLYTNLDDSLPQAEANHLEEFTQRRLCHEPTAYIIQQWEFYGLNFYLDRHVLIPRPETELLVEKAIESAFYYSLERSPTLADIGTGSGAIAISLALALPRARIYASDISMSALEVADMNCRRHKVDNQVRLLCGSLLEPLLEPVDMIVANLPYIRDHELKMLSPEITNFEPMIALAGGKDGLDQIRSLLAQIPAKIRPAGCFLMEIGEGQAQTVTAMINACFPESSIELIPDLGGIDRVVKVVF